MNLELALSIIALVIALISCVVALINYLKNDKYLKNDSLRFFLIYMSNYLVFLNKQFYLILHFIFKIEK